MNTVTEINEFKGFSIASFQKKNHSKQESKINGARASVVDEYSSYVGTEC